MYLSSTLEDCLSRYDTFLKFFDNIPPIERDIFKYYCDFKMNQKEISRITGLTQGAISHRISRMFKRLDFLEEREKFCVMGSDQMFKKLKRYCDPFEIELLKAAYETTSQSHSAFRLNFIFNLTGEQKINQVKLKYAFERLLIRLKNTEFYPLFRFINQNWYVLSEVRLPQFDRSLDG